MSCMKPYHLWELLSLLSNKCSAETVLTVSLFEQRHGSNLYSSIIPSMQIALSELYAMATATVRTHYTTHSSFTTWDDPKETAIVPCKLQYFCSPESNNLEFMSFFFFLNRNKFMPTIELNLFTSHTQFTLF